MRRNGGSKLDPNWARSHGRGQIYQDEVLDNYYHVTSALGTLHSEGYVTISIF